MKDKLFWIGGFAFIALMVTGMTQSSGDPIWPPVVHGLSTDLLTTGMPLTSEICDNGADDNGDGLRDCDDPACSASPLCNQGDVCPETTDLFLTTNLAQPAPRRCTSNATDSDGRNPLTPGCLTYYDENTCATVVNFAWDECTNATTLLERYTTARDKTSCASPTSLSRNCSTWFEYIGATCPGDAAPVCVTQRQNCGGVQRNIGFCACPALIALADVPQR
jgi:hypothetical protein